MNAAPIPASITAADPVTDEPWQVLRRYTDARIALGRAGNSLPTAAHLAFQWAHAQARDAVHLPLDADGLAASLRALGCPTVLLHSAALDRATYLQRPDLGRRLDQRSRQRLAAAQPAFDVALVLADGLSALAVHSHALALVAAIQARLHADTDRPWRLAPVTVVEQGRVAIGDEIGAALQARCVVVLIGERPGLSSPDSLGVYLTWAPRVGLSDASRNCISNIRAAGLSVDAAADKLHWLLTQARLRRLSGVALKDEMGAATALSHAEAGPGNFLLAAP